MRALFAAVTLAACGLGLVASAAKAADDAERRAKIVLRVGDKRTVTVGELEDRLAEVPPFQAQIWGSTREEVVKKFTNDYVLRDLLLGVAAEQKKLDQSVPTKHQLQRALSTATLRATRGAFKSPAAIPTEEIAKYYADNRTRFESPERVNLWRILCKTHEEAETVLGAAKKELTIPKWTDLAREHSVDKATNFRGGNLGFVAADGTSNEAGLKVDPALVKGASTAKDGEVVPHPVPEGAAFAVIWRRTTVPATHRSLEEVSAQIRTTLFRERTEAAEKKLIEELRAKNVRDYDPDPLKIIVIPALDAGLNLPRSVPGQRDAGR